MGAFLLSLTFIVAIALVLLQWFKHPGSFIEQQYGPMPKGNKPPPTRPEPEFYAPVPK